MRNLVKLFLLVMLTAGISSCQKIKSLFDVEFDTTLSGDLNIDIPESSKKAADFSKFEASALMNPLTDEDIDEYSENIEEFDVTKVLGEVTYVNKENIVFKSGTSFYIKDNTSTVTWILDNDWSIVVGTQLTLGDLGNEIYKEVGEILGKLDNFTVGIDGECSESGVSVDVEFIIEVTVVANPL
jgi:hypothetical protein